MPIWASQIIAIDSTSGSAVRKSAGHQRHRREVAVGGVVDDGADPRSGQIGRKAEIGHEEQQA